MHCFQSTDIEGGSSCTRRSGIICGCWGQSVDIMSAMRTFLTSLSLLGVFGVGYGMWATIIPGEEKKRELLKNLPESNPARMEETRRKNALMLQVLKDAAENDENFARGYGGPK